MDSHEQADAYHSELNKLTERFMEEFDMTYVQLIGVLEMYKMEVFCEAMAVAFEEDEDGDDEYNTVGNSD